MNTYLVIYKDSSGQEFQDEVSATNQDNLQDIIREAGYNIVSYEEIIKNKTFFDSVVSYFNNNFSQKGYSEKNELLFLKAFFTARKKGLSNTEALKLSKLYFGKSSKNIRKIIDDIIQTNSKGGFTLFELFQKHEELFSDNTLILLKQVEGKEVDLNKVITNLLSEDKKGQEVEGYVELVQSLRELLEEIKKNILPPIAYFFLLTLAVFTITVTIIPNLIITFKKILPKGKIITYGPIENFVLASSDFILSYGLIILIPVILGISAITFLYNSNTEIKKGVQHFLLKMPIVGDILTLFYTKRIISMFSVFNKTGMRNENMYDSLIKLTPLLPMKEELEFLQSHISTIKYYQIFPMYSDDNKYLTEMFYSRFEIASRVGGDYDSACADILDNINVQWTLDLKQKPKIVGRWIIGIGMTIVGINLLGVLLIYIGTTMGSIS